MPAYGSFAELYDRFTYDVNYAEFADHYEKIFTAAGKSPKTVLDLACGSGSLTAVMAERGYEMISVDASPEMLSIAREKCAEISGITPPLFLCQSMGELDLFGTVDAAVSSLDSLNYLPLEELNELFRLLRLFIEPQGIFIFDINAPEHLRSLDGQISVDEDEEGLCLWRAELNEDETALFYGIDIFKKRGRFWQRDFEEHVEYIHEPEMLKSLLEQAGFTGVELLENGPHAELGRLFFTARNG